MIRVDVRQTEWSMVLGVVLLGAALSAWGAEISFKKHTIDGNHDFPQAVFGADVDGDGDIDVLAAGYNENKITWWENTNGVGTSWNEHTIDANFTGAHWVYGVDIDQDGDLDVLGAADLGNQITWWENRNGLGTFWTEHTVDACFNRAFEVYAADIDGDDDPDIVAAAYGASDICWWESKNGATSWAKRTVDGSFSGADGVYAADVDGDGDIDILGAAKDANDVVWWENENGAGTSWEKHRVDDAFRGTGSVVAADLDGDEDLDILASAYLARDVAWWENKNSSGTSWDKHTVDSDFPGVTCVYAVDIDGDEDLDILATARGVSTMVWWENTDGTGTNLTKHTLEGYFEGPTCVHAADIDGDGDMDILGAAYIGDEIAWWENLGIAPTPTPIAETYVKLFHERARAGESLLYPINVNDVTDFEITSFELVLTYDADLLSVDQVRLGPLVAKGWANPAVNNQPGWLAIAAASVNPLEGEGELAVLDLQISPTAPSGAVSPMTVEHIQFNEFTESPYTAALHGSVTAARKYGDVSGSGRVGPYDAALTLLSVVELMELTLEDAEAADVTGNDDVSALDASKILQYVVRLINHFPVEELSKRVDR